MPTASAGLEMGKAWSFGLRKASMVGNQCKVRTKNGQRGSDAIS